MAKSFVTGSLMSLGANVTADVYRWVKNGGPQEVVKTLCQNKYRRVEYREINSRPGSNTASK